jgi:hypothetical protein
LVMGSRAGAPAGGSSSKVAPAVRRAARSTSGRMPSTPSLPSRPARRLRRSLPYTSGT